MNASIYGGEYDGEGRYIGDDSRLLDAAETLVTLQTSEMGSGSNNPLFGSTINHSSIAGKRLYS